MRPHVYLVYLLVFSTLPLAGQLSVGDAGLVPPYSSQTEERTYPPSTRYFTGDPGIPDTTGASAAYVGPFLGGYKVLRRDRKMGLLNADLSLRVPFHYDDIQVARNGTDPQADLVLLARRSPYGRYATLDASGAPTSDFVFSYNDRLQVYHDYVVDNPLPKQYFVWHRDGRAAGDDAYSLVWSHPLLLTRGHRVLSVSHRDDHRKVALFNLDLGRVTPFDYKLIHPVEPVIAPRTYIPLLEGHSRLGIRLLRPDGRLLSEKYFVGVEDYNNWKQLRTFFGLPDDPKAEAIAWTIDMDVYIVYEDDSVIFMGRYTGY